MCTPINKFSFSGDITINGKTTKYTGQSFSLPAGFKECYSRQGNKLTITSTSASGTFVNVLSDVGGRINGTLKYGPNATVTVDGTARFN